MTTPTKLLTTTLMLMWIQQTDPCLVLYPVDKIIKFQEMKKQIKKQEKTIEELNKKQEALYREEHNLLQQEPEYFPEENIDFADFAELLPEEYGYSGNGEIISNESSPEESQDDVDYPEFPSTKDDNDYDYSEFEKVTQELTDVDETEEYEGEKYEEYYGKFFPKEKRDKRDAGEVLEGLMESGEKLLSGNMVGSITSFLKTLAKPVFHYFIKSDNDKAMTKFTHRLLPETGFKGSSNALVISKAARQGDGERVWSTIAENTQTWNPRSSFKDDKFHKNEIHLECRRNVPLIDKNVVNRLKSVSLMVTSLMTSLHDTTISDLNHGFKEASRHFKKIIEDTDHILKATTNNPDIDTILMMLKDTAAAMEIVMETLADDSVTIMGLAVAGAIAFLIILQAIILIKLNRDIKLSIMDINLKLQELEKQRDQGSRPERASVNLDQELRNAVIHAVNEAVELSVGNAVGRTVARTQCPAIEQSDTNARLPTGTRYLGNIVSLQSTTGGRQVTY